MLNTNIDSIRYLPFSDYARFIIYFLNFVRRQPTHKKKFIEIKKKRFVRAYLLTELIANSQ